MKPLSYLSFATWLLALLARLFLIGPATIVAFLIGTLLVFSTVSTRDFVEGIYQWADVSVRHAPDGQIDSHQCLDDRPADLKRQPPSFSAPCLHPKTVSEPAALVIDRVSSGVRQLYGIFVLLSGAWIFGFSSRNRAIKGSSSSTPDSRGAGGARSA